jgi:hypothetical protein
MQGRDAQPITRLITVGGHIFVYQAWLEAAGDDFPGQARAAFRHRMFAPVRCDPSVSIWSMTFRSPPLPIGHRRTLADLAYEHFRDQLGWPVEPYHFSSTGR